MKASHACAYASLYPCIYFFRCMRVHLQAHSMQVTTMTSPRLYLCSCSMAPVPTSVLHLPCISLPCRLDADSLGSSHLRTISKACPNLESLHMDRVCLTGPLTDVVFGNVTFLELDCLAGDFNADDRGMHFPLDILAPRLESLSLIDMEQMFRGGPLRHPSLSEVYYYGAEFCDRNPSVLVDTFMRSARFLPAVTRLECHLESDAFSCEACPRVDAHDSPQAELRRAHVESCLLTWFGQWTQLHTLVLDIKDSSYPDTHNSDGGPPPLLVLLPTLAATLGGTLYHLQLDGCVLGPAADARRTLLCLPSFARLRSLVLAFCGDCGDEELGPTDESLRALVGPLVHLHARLPPQLQLDLRVNRTVTVQCLSELMAANVGLLVISA